MKNFKIVLFIGVFLFITNIGKAQYFERDEIKNFEGKWLAMVHGADSVILEMNMEKKYPLKNKSVNTGYQTDVLLMNINYYQSGEIVYSPLNIDSKHRNHSFVAVLVSPSGSDNVTFQFTYEDDNNSTAGAIGMGKLKYIDGVLEMEIDNRREGIHITRPNGDKKSKNSSKLSIPKQLTFKKKGE
ncbi:hypothetical protein [Anditalea andensis]|uniref:Uncharacterized protein n=1 Tax=Anditalea andensis TaxID=1048983 RepID=A0A074L734_9BACT|nr:hypothetical protein [Anditalea andensis]KEO75623.1 hypothetical protein EL17_00605 [Anditalea andensis]